MHIAFFVWEYPPCLVGGLGNYARDVTREMKKLGQKISVFTLNPKKEGKNELPTHESIRGIKVHRPAIFDCTEVLKIISEELKRWGEGAKFFGDMFTYNFLSASKLVNQLVWKENYDIASIHDWLSAIAGMVVKENSSLPVVFHVHSTEELRANLSPMIKELEHKMAERAERVITVSHAMKQHLIEIGYPAEKIHVVWNGVDEKTFSPKRVKRKVMEKWRERHGIEEGEKIVLFVGRLTRIKGVENLILAFPHVLERFPRAKLVIIGKGEEYGHLVELARNLGIEERVRIISEWLGRDDLLANYALADVCVFPSLAEPFGIVSLEAMAMEKPVVVGARGVSGLREQVISAGEKQCGVHVNQFSPEDIAWGINLCLEDEERAREWGKNARERVLEEFTIEKTAKKTLEIYEEVCR